MKHVSITEQSRVKSIAEHWSQFTEAERQLIRTPETHYTSLAATKTRRIIG